MYRIEHILIGLKTKGWKILLGSREAVLTGLFPHNFCSMESVDYGISYMLWETKQGLFRAKIKKIGYSKATNTVLKGKSDQNWTFEGKLNAKEWLRTKAEEITAKIKRCR